MGKVMQCLIQLLCWMSFVGALKEYRLLEDVAKNTQMIPISGYRENTTAFLFTESRRRYRVSKKLKDNLINAMASGREFIFVTTFRQEKKGQGTLLSFIQKSGKRLMDVQSAWKKREIRFNYVVNLHSSQMHTERFPYEISDGQWHQLALAFSGLRATMFVDCQKVYVHTLPHTLPFSELTRSGSLWVGQRAESRTGAYFVGAMESNNFVVGGEDQYLQKCKERLTDSCPSCHQHLHVVSLVFTLQEKLEALNAQIEKNTKLLQERQSCECLRRCRNGNRTYNDGDRWAIGKCKECVCKNGETKCGETKCPLLNCKFPIKVESDCCPRCSVSCEFKGVVFEHGEKRISKSEKVCVICTCQHGGMRCRQYRNMSLICPKLPCPLSEQFSTPDDCCNFCPNTDFCAMNANCHKNADCVNLSTKHICKCKPGYRGNGYYCEDIDECKDASQRGNDLCGWNSKCVNLNGTYECRCNTGFVKDQYNFCVDYDECRGGVHKCHPKAICLNRDGSHTCQCRHGYLGNGYNCTALCDGQCLNGGLCLEPNICECPTGFRGSRCHIDIDECALGIHKCHENSKCVNLPGSYHCECKTGFTDDGRSNQFGKLCADINECLSRPGTMNTCNSEMVCRNLIGSYECVCKEGTDCNKDCFYEISRRTKRPVKNGIRFFDPWRYCHACKCMNGKITCKPFECDCSKPRAPKCCRNCKRYRRCRHRGVSYDNGASWTSNCTQCTCEEGRQTCRPLLCPSMTSCSKVIKLKGHCCPTCASDNICNLPMSVNPLSLGGPGVCHHQGRTFRHLQSWTLSDNLCITCQCKFGHVCCSHDGQCSAKLSRVT